MVNKKYLGKIRPHCKEMVMGGKHLKAYLKNGKMVVIATSTKDEKNEWNNIKRNFRRCGILL